MIIFINPMFSNYRNLNGDSCYIVIKNIIEPVLKLRPDYHFVIAWPKDGFVYSDDGFFKHKNIHRVPIEIPKRKMDSVVHFNMNYWRKVFEMYTPDIIWNHVPEVGHLFNNLYTGFDVEMTKPIVFNQHHYVIHHTLPYPIDAYRPIQFQQLGSFMVNLNLFNSDYCKSMFDDNVKEFMSPTVHYPYEIVKFAFIGDDYPEPQPAKGIVKIIYNHRLQDYKNYLETFELLAQLWTTYKNFKVIVTNPNGSNFSKLAQYPFVEGKSITSHEDYLKELSTCHLNITNSQHETFCISALESLAFGQILVAPKAITFPELVPKKDYPYLFNNEEEQYRILESLLKDPTIFDKERDRIRKATKETFDQKIIANKYANLFEEYGKSPWGDKQGKENTLKAIEAVKKTFKGFVTLKKVKGLFEAHNLGTQAMPLLKVKRIINSLGYSDMIQGYEQGFYF